MKSQPQPASMNNMNHCIRNHYFVAFFVTLTVSIALIVGGYFAPPEGVVDGSILKAVGELFLWPTLALGAKALDDGKRIKLQTGKTTITVGKMQDEPVPEEVIDDENVDQMEGETEDD